MKKVCVWLRWLIVAKLANEEAGYGYPQNDEVIYELVWKDTPVLKNEMRKIFMKCWST